MILRLILMLLIAATATSQTLLGSYQQNSGVGDIDDIKFPITIESGTNRILYLITAWELSSGNLVTGASIGNQACSRMGMVDPGTAASGSNGLVCWVCSEAVISAATDDTLRFTSSGGNSNRDFIWAFYGNVDQSPLTQDSCEQQVTSATATDTLACAITVNAVTVYDTCIATNMGTNADFGTVDLWFEKDDGDSAMILMAATTDVGNSNSYTWAAGQTERSDLGSGNSLNVGVAERKVNIGVEGATIGNYIHGPLKTQIHGKDGQTRIHGK